MRKILFVCHGNICRSVMAEFIFKDKAKDLDYECESRALSNEEEGNDIYYAAKEVLDKHHILYTRHCAKKITLRDYEHFDDIYIMDSSNQRIIGYMFDDYKHKIKKLAPYDVADPWYTRDFEKTFNEISMAIDCIIKTW